MELLNCICVFLCSYGGVEVYSCIVVELWSDGGWSCGVVYLWSYIVAYVYMCICV